MVERLAAALKAVALFSLTAMNMATLCAHAQEGGCREPIVDGNRAQAIERSLSTRDLVELRDIGSLSPERDAPLFTISPDEHHLALQVHQANVDTNRYCLSLYVLEIGRPSSARQIDAGDDLILSRRDYLGIADYVLGNAKTITPIWSPDGAWVYWLKKQNGHSQLWRASIDGSATRRISDADTDVFGFRLSLDGCRILYSAIGNAQAIAEAFAEERDEGFHFDARYFPMWAATPTSHSPDALSIFALDLASLQIRAASPSDRNAFRSASETLARPNATMRLVWHRTGTVFPVQWQAEAVIGERTIRCDHPPCSGEKTESWIDDRRGEVYFSVRTGWGDGAIAIYRWNPLSGAFNRLIETDDLIFSCASAESGAICAVEEPGEPRKIMLFSPDFSTRSLLFDPNPGFSAFRLGKIFRVKARNSFGIPVYADVVLPVGYSRKKRYPAIVVQYVSRGFLRGGTGDEVPIHVLGARGYVVVSVQRPSPLAVSRQATSDQDAVRQGLVDFKDRRSALSAIEAMITRLTQMAIVDPRRVGISGLSDGSSTVQYAAFHSSLFAAASMGSCCWEPEQEALLGQRIGDIYSAAGWPSKAAGSEDFWKQISISMTPEKVAFPILMQLSDREYLLALRSYWALKSAKKVVDLFVFANEYHIKWQPAHKLSVYNRNICWFDFWLKGESAPSCMNGKDWANWLKMAERLPTQMSPPLAARPSHLSQP